MDIRVKNISKTFPCRENIIKQFYQYYGDEDSFPQATFFYGHTSTGKTSILTAFLELIESEYVFINCIECYTTKILFETIINEFRQHVLSSENKFTSFAKIDSMKAFVQELINLEEQNSYIIVMENAEKLRDMDHNIFPMFLRLQEVCGLNISTIFVTSLPMEKFYPKTGISEVVKIFAPEYTKKEVSTIMLSQFDVVLGQMRMENAYSSLPEEKKEVRGQIIAGLKSDFYENYLNIFLNVFYKVCRDLKELQIVAQDCFKKYCEPVLDGTIDQNDVTKLWRNISKVMKSALGTIYMRMGCDFDEESLDSTQTIKKIAQTLELPYYAKYLLIAAYLASHNAAKEDKRLFMKYHGKQKKRLQTVNAKAKVSEKMSTQLGPKSFTVDRLLAIFYAILEEKVGLTCNLLAQISTLVHLKFITFAAGENNIMDGSARLQCTVGMDFIMHIGKVVGFNVRQYLCDFF